jgi:hypothetical protein
MATCQCAFAAECSFATIETPAQISSALNGYLLAIPIVVALFSMVGATNVALEIGCSLTPNSAHGFFPSGQLFCHGSNKSTLSPIYSRNAANRP